ncbi:sugar transferase [Ruania halotolerans]|uniref:sugar transferase n=1 Tax=Ruania halotolerans TaxID=2897773 RepID=UPI001E5BA21F|nr:sugar transferase [Ruania halotolerans]UFU07265.1 sugar transferase [Ruania halotolerans]
MSYTGKRFLDLAVAIPAFVLTSPIQALAAVAVRVSMGPPVFFRQQRPGLLGKPFEMIKLRTMRPAGPSGATDDASRLTSVGRFLRATSIDELPALLNVIRGDMSLVGPRPLLMQYLDEYTPEQARRHEVKPGLTGLAQVMGRNAISWSARFTFDLDYVDKHSLRRDLHILGLTTLRVFQRRGIAAPGEATMPRFRAGEGVEK